MEKEGHEITLHDIPCGTFKFMTLHHGGMIHLTSNIMKES